MNPTMFMPNTSGYTPFYSNPNNLMLFNNYTGGMGGMSSTGTGSNSNMMVLMMMMSLFQQQSTTTIEKKDNLDEEA